MRIMYITTTLRAPNGVCASNVIEALIEAGRKVIVFTQKNDNEVKCPCEVVYSKCRNIHAIKESFNRTTLGKKIQRLTDLLYRVWTVLCYPIWPINSPQFVYLFSREAYRVAQRNNVDMIITEYGDIACLNAGRYIKKRDKRIKAVAYFIDALYCGAKPNLMPEKTKNRKAIGWENKMLKDFDRVIMMEATKSHYMEVQRSINYFKKIRFLDLPMLKVCDHSISIVSNVTDKIKFVYIGSMPRNIRNPQYILNLFKAINNDDWQFDIYGNNEYLDLVSEYSKYNIKYKGVVSHEDAINIIADADYLINIGNSMSEMVPSKIFEYMSYGKPIISTFKIDNDPCVKYLELYGESISLDESTSVLDSENQLRNFMNKERPDDMIIHLRKLSSVKGSLYKNTPQAFVDWLEDFNDSTGKM